jgi:Flp pilus assembly secretin CpaC
VNNWIEAVGVMAWSLSSTAYAAVMLLANALLIPANPARAADTGIVVEMNEAKIVKLARPADTIVVGNPLIADASVQDASTIVLTAKGFGVTNLVILDGEGNAIVDEQVTVVPQTASSVRVYRRSEIQTLSCTPYCASPYKSEAERASEAEMSASGP